MRNNNEQTSFIFKRQDGFIYNTVLEDVFLAYKPEIPVSIRNVESVPVLGKSSSVTYDYKSYKDRQVTIPLIMMNYDNEENFNFTFSGIPGDIKFNYKRGFYRIKTIDLISPRDAKGILELDLFVTLAPFMFLEEIKKEFITTSIKEHIFKNEGNIESPCIIKIEYIGKCEFDFNNYRFIIDDSNTTIKTIIIDSKALQVHDGISNKGELLSGSMDNVKVINGNNNFTVVLGNINKISIEWNPTIYD